MAATLFHGDVVDTLPDGRYPYCAGTGDDIPAPTGDDANRRVVVVLLPNVGSRELAQVDEAGAWMPALRRLAGLEGAEGAGASEGETRPLSYSSVFATGEMPEDALVSILSGQPPAQSLPILRDPALPSLPGVARDLAHEGFSAVYLGGERSSAVHREAYLRHAGFDEVLFPALDRASVEEARATFARALSQLDAPAPGGQLLVVHPVDRNPEDPRQPADAAALRVRLAALDRAFEEFYGAYAEGPRGEGVVLIAVGAHSAPLALSAPVEPATEEAASHEPRFGVPLIVDGLRPDERARLEESTERLASHTDLPRALLSLYGLRGPSTRACYYGRDLFEAPGGAEGSAWPERRAPLSIGGDSRQFVVAHDGDLRWRYDIFTREFQLHNIARDPELQRDLFADDDPEFPRMREYVLSHLAIQNYLRQTGHYMPGGATNEARASIPGWPPPRALVNDRGQLEGPGDGVPLEQSHDQVEAAQAAGFRWIALDTHLTGDGHFVTIGDARVMPLSDRVIVTVNDATREQLRTLRRPAPSVQELLARHPRMRFIFHVHEPVRRAKRDEFVARLVAMAGALPAERVVLMSDDAPLAELLASRLDVPVVYRARAPGEAAARRWIGSAGAMGVDGLVLPAASVTPSILRAADEAGVVLGAAEVTAPAWLERRGVTPEAIRTLRLVISSRPLRSPTGGTEP